MARPKVVVRAPWPSSPSRTGALPVVEGQQGITATVLRPSTVTVKQETSTPNANQGPIRTRTAPVVDQGLQRLQVKTEPTCSRCGLPVVKVEEGVDAGTCSVLPSSVGSQGAGASASKKREGERKASIVGTKPRAARSRERFKRGFKFSKEDLESDEHLMLKDKAAKLGVSMTTFKKRRKEMGLGRWQGRANRAAILKRAQAQARA